MVKFYLWNFPNLDAKISTCVLKSWRGILDSHRYLEFFKVPEYRADNKLRGALFMLIPKHLDDLARYLSGSLPKGLQVLQEDIDRNLRASLEGGLAKLDLVTREELDVQTAVLARTREKLERLETVVAELEQRLGVGEGLQQRPTPSESTTTPT